jgi:site-specific recombinase XerD
MEHIKTFERIPALKMAKQLVNQLKRNRPDYIYLLENMRKLGSAYLFESSWKKPYTTVGIRKMIATYSKLADISKLLSPQKFRHSC